MAKLNVMQMSAEQREAHNQAQLDKLTNVAVPSIAFHSEALKQWQVKRCGPKPTAEMLKVNYVLAADRRSGIEPLWVAMTFRANGATVGEYMSASVPAAGGAAHNNAKKINDQGKPAVGWLMRVPLPNTDRNGRWQHVFTEKGIAQLDKRIAQLSAAANATAAPAKVKPVKKAKAKKAKAKNGVSVAPVTVTPEVNADVINENLSGAKLTHADVAADKAYFDGKAETPDVVTNLKPL